MNAKTSHFVTALSASADAGGVPTEIQLLPDGLFRASDGRPADLAGWQMDAAIAAPLLQQAAGRANPFLIDFEHQTLLTKQNGQPAPAAGWFSALAYREGSGLWATGVAWTPRAAAMIAAGEYRFISPVFTFDAQGRVTRLLHAALTNDPALDGMAAVAAAYRLDADSADSLSTFLPLPHAQPHEALTMDDILERIVYLLNLPITATPDEVAAELDKLKAMILADASGTAAASFGGLIAHLTALTDAKRGAEQQVAALSATHQPMVVVEQLKAEVAALRAEQAQRDREALIADGLADGRLLPVQADWARTQSPAALSAYLASTPPIAALAGTQTDGVPPVVSASMLTPDEITACRLLGQSEADYLSRKSASGAQ